MALAPITAPDITSICKDASSGIGNQEGAIRTRKCCPPSLGKKIKDFQFPNDKKVRMRWPAHKGTKKQVDDYRRAIAAMRALPDDDPRSFVSQAKIHCAYCNGGYTQVDSGFPDIDIQIHNSWLFFPFHRWYLYFYERILGSLIDEPNFALPYWKWDEPKGMPISNIFLGDASNPLYDQYRDANHIEDRIVDLDYDGKDKDIPDQQQVACNLSTVYRDLVRNGVDPTSFFGGKYVAGDSPVANGDPSVGSVEAGSHTAVHRWVGDPTQPNNEDMGNFYSAGYDPVFYIHHANVDRMWKLWKELRLPGHVDITDPDWLNASYVFYDENKDLVRVYNKDCVNLDKLKYNFIENSKEVFPWRNSRPPQRRKSAQVATTGDVKTVEQTKFPVRLNQIFKVRVKRPAVNRTEEEKDQANEVLLIKKIKYDSGKFVKFDVFVNDKLKDGVFTTPCDPEYAGGFAQIPHNDKRSMVMTSTARFGLNELLEDTNTEGEEYATVTLVPRTGCEDLTVGEIKIELVPIPKA
uniref:Aurone synthase n=1 Tax=Coreopsis grandiflora TaxID=13449 RepID=UPI00077DEF9F|nr:Chain A, Aurone synthase [Coreopsis grandiflora]4Z12_B Chain B, Aurone synthase [Coreopsis grandiflora]4Z13_A Chain A, Aurone synthase [Coreopsis grandiflora]4Z13_B Chain B, Aurone synthase [Coreopsis grandiflora]4Z14_A Chain A, Aurone synthase [Coreopsis grandiflora]4Z14_B Chain B, Aurone synthase [Coreopsis grandiflora]4Z14_C Chain C, Aurone synthase [Coreopsis grandiflora]4Z14_D Chain D, Aurone synthase [Coreopsis grandiflora]4Z14_E Chain E, Aurone synthase [Coreopsis grandiflora]4Z1